MWVEALFRAFDERAGDTAFRFDDETLTYGALDALSRRFAAGLLELGVRKGDRVASLLPTRTELIVALFGCYRIGAIFVPINTRYRRDEVAHVLSDSGACRVLVESDSSYERLLDDIGAAPPRIVVPSDGGDDDDDDTDLGIDIGGPVVTRWVSGQAMSRVLRADPVEGPPAVEDEDIALLIYTSGTTGKSKGVALSFRAVASNIDALTRLWEWTLDDVLVLALPLFHVHGLGIGVHGTVIRGCAAILHDRFRPEQVAEAIAGGATVFMGVPTMYALLARAMDADPSIAAALTSARLLTSGSAPLSTALFERFETATGHRILERYGMTETLLTLSNPYRGERRSGSVGVPVPGCDVRVVDEEMRDVEEGEVGEIIVRGDSLLTEYWKQPEATRDAFRDGWFMTGDAATIDERGYVYVVGRRSVDIIKSGGFKISAREIEEVLERDARVAEVAVVGLPDPVWGEQITAFVVPEAAARRDNLAESLMALTRDTLADYKAVRAVHLVRALPRNALGKVQKHALK